MKTLYIQCNMGCAGDMLMSALSELLPNKDEFFPLVSIDKIPNAVMLDTRYGVKIYSPTCNNPTLQ